MGDKPNIDQTKTDIVISVAKAGASAYIDTHLPGFGGIIAEIISTLIPNQREDRIRDFLQILDKQVAELGQDVLEQKMKTKEFIDLLEDALWQAVRALTPERKEKIAAVLKHSLYEGELQHLYKKKLLSLLNELNDAQLIMLKAKALEYTAEEASFYDQHEDVLEPIPIHMDSSDEELDQDAFHQAFESDLYRLGLLEVASSEQSLQISHLGRLLLRYVDMADDEEGEGDQEAD